MTTIFRVPLSKLIQMSASPLTRDNIISVARNFACEQVVELRLIVTVDCVAGDPNADIEIATIELIRAPTGEWALQYISHPRESDGLTQMVLPVASDFSAYVQRRKRRGLSGALIVLSATQLELEGLGPLASLNLRTHCCAPVVPSEAVLPLLDASTCDITSAHHWC